MKIFSTVLVVLVVLLCSVNTNPGLFAQEGESQKYYFGLEINGVLCGYTEIEISEIEKDGKEYILLDENVFAMLTALGAEVNTSQKIEYYIDPGTGNFIYHYHKLDQGSIKLEATYTIKGDTAYLYDFDKDTETKIALPKDVLLPNTMIFSHIKNGFIDGGVKEKTYKFLEARDAQVEELTITKVDDEELELVGKIYQTIKVEQYLPYMGLRFFLWIDKETGYLVQMEIPGMRKQYLTDASVVKRIQVASVDENILLKTNETIVNIQGIRYLKVKAAMEPIGLLITEEGLNVHGQTFEGTVEENYVEGIFEIEHRLYSGENAPPFPPDFSDDEALKDYLEPSNFCESDDPVLIEKAKEITGGSKDSWEAATRLSEWVGRNIGYEIPGGGTARNTYDIRAGECGAHSMLLAAFCRAVGIPARVVWGCMYVPNYGGSFGQHGWNEIYMGESGWIPVDATAQEYKFVDSGHLRVGVMKSTSIALNLKEAEILDYRLDTGSEDEAEQKYAAFIGKYSPQGSDKIFEVLVHGGRLAVDIPDKMVIAFLYPDEEGKWYCQLSPSLYLKFDVDQAGKATAMELCESTVMARIENEKPSNEEVPEEFKPLIGKYIFQAINLEFEIAAREGNLLIIEPESEPVKLVLMADKGLWESTDKTKIVEFQFGEEGQAKGMKVTFVTRMISQ
ncbi:transglutaminase domain-containing protein [bacterium]|nr:transglutaminase domain-containing protein [bacterium]